VAKEDEWVPWYRRKEYTSNITEDEKRYLDSFRLEKKHPAAALEDQPSEVQRYVSELELAVDDKTQEGIARKAFILTGIGAFVIFVAYREIGWNSPLIDYVVGSAFIAFAWISYFRECKKNTYRLWIEQKGKGVPFDQAEEKLQEYWELDAISRYRKGHDPKIDDDLD
jgi:hypothetical protein